MSTKPKTNPTKEQASFIITGTFDIPDMLDQIEVIQGAVESLRQYGSAKAQVTIEATTTFTVDP